jgi:hypothetical protein
MTMSASIRLMSATSSGTTSASTVAVLSCTPTRSSRLLALASHLLRVLLASVMSPNVSAFIAHLKVTTLPTPPAPMIRVFLFIVTPRQLCEYFIITYILAVVHRQIK